MKIAVIFGGMSSERDVSIASGAQIFKALKSKNHDVIAVDTATGILDRDDEINFLNSKVKEIPPDSNRKSLMKGLGSLIRSGRLSEFDICFLALHGGSGEDGTIQGYLDIEGIPYTGSTHMPCCYAMDKHVAKTLFRHNNVMTPDWLMAPVTAAEAVDKLGLPLVVKPNREGSTVGLSIVKSIADFDKAILTASQHDREILVEKYIPGRELTIGVVDDIPLGVGEIIPKMSEIFDYKCKYQKGGADEIFPADLTTEQTKYVMDTAVKAHKALKMDDYSRVDFRMAPDGSLWCLEVNALPGMTASSLLPQSAEVMNISFPDLCEKICLLAIERRKRG
ncbi:MAG: D-alanine--D-alanine ligase [Spirochaetia bacterium]|jgi:D-alanine-D-alanine ligase|nr:D-alanine--D-alanine ligase [Spirochaetia bacterium]